MLTLLDNAAAGEPGAMAVIPIHATEVAPTVVSTVQDASFVTVYGSDAATAHRAGRLDA